jgi:Putative beta-barrel porin-2, OmpL-like. bbp2
MKKLILFLFLYSSFGFSQEDAKLKTTFSGFLETYYSYDLNEPRSDAKLPFMYNYNRHNEFAVNIGLIRMKAEYDNVYGSIALHSGTYVDDNYAAEKTKYINEAFVGMYLDASKKQTIEVGILPSYIGFETATSASNLTLTRSLLAENSPYFMTGAKYTYKPSDQWSFSGLLTNGWQRINKPNRKVLPSFGSQIVYKPSATATLNWSTYVGDEPLADDLQTRYFSNLYYDFAWKSKFRTIVGFDYGMQQKQAESGFSSWLTPVLITQYYLNTKWQTAFRAEYYQDEKNVIIATSDEFKTFGASVNFDYLPNSKVKLRNELRYLDADKDLFIKNGNTVNSNLFFTTSLSFEF